LSTAHRSKAGRARRLVAILAALTAATCLASGPAASSAAAETPINSYSPEVEILGKLAVGENLLCYAGSWTGGVSSFTFQWLREGAIVAEGESNGVANEYTITKEDQGFEISCNVIAHNSEGTGEEESSNSVEVPGGPASKPEPIEAPVVSGKPVVGEMLSCSQGTWQASPAPTFAYKWLRDGTAIASATSSTYQVSTADQGHTLSCEVTATNTAGSTSQVSSNSLEVAAPSLPRNEVPPEVSGVGELNKSLTCSSGKWSGEPAPTFTYQWLRGGAVISGATASLYTIQVADQGQSLSCDVTATNSQGPASRESVNSIHIRDSTPENTEAPKIKSGVVEVGKRLTCEKGTWNGVPTPTFTFQWLIGGAPIPLATEPSYTVVKEDEGQSLSCEVIATNSEGVAVPATSAAVVVPGGSGSESKPENVEPPQVTGTAAVGSTLTCFPGRWNGTPTPTLTYAWMHGGEVLAETNTYTVAAKDQGHSLSCVVTAKNNSGSVFAQSSNSAEVPPAISPSDTERPEVFGMPIVGETLSCSQGVWNGQPMPTYTFQWLRDGAEIRAATANSYVVKSEDRGHTLSCVVTATNVNGHAEATSGHSVHIAGVAPENKTEPQVTVLGRLEVGEPLRCEPGEWSGVPTPTISYQWLVNGEPIALATERDYPLVTVDQGRSISCKVTATNGEGSESAISKSVRVSGVVPENVEAPHIAGGSAVGETLTCEPGVWVGKPSPRYTFEWLRDGTVISSEPERKHTIGSADEGHSLSCAVIATNSEGHAEASSTNSVEIPAEQTKPTLKELQAPVLLGATAPPAPVVPQTTPATTTAAASIPQSLSAQLTRAGRRVRIASLLKSGSYSFAFAAPTAGTLELFWYGVPKGAHGSAKSKPLVVASSTTSFVGATTRTVRLRLTSEGRTLIKHGRPIKLTVKGVFLPTGQRSVTWVDTLVLSS
jgi:hypothetical protein